MKVSEIREHDKVELRHGIKTFEVWELNIGVEI